MLGVGVGFDDKGADKDFTIFAAGMMLKGLTAHYLLHKTYRVGPGDTIVLASSLIPGNENAVNRVVNGLARLGAHVVHKGNALVHVSGHAAAGELRYVYNIVKPRNVLPVHGEWRHMRANAEIAEGVGIDPDRIVLAEDGTVLDLVDGRLTAVGYVPVGFVYVDGAGVGDVTETSLKDRRVLGEEGFAPLESADGPLYQDDNHLSRLGAERFLRGLAERVLLSHHPAAEPAQGHQARFLGHGQDRDRHPDERAFDPDHRADRARE